VFVADLEEVGTGHVLVDRYAFDGVGQQIANVLPLAGQRGGFRDGRPRYTTTTAIALMVFYVFAMQCASTVIIVRRETGGWKWPLFQFFYMAVLAWGGSFLVWQLGNRFF